MRLGGGVGEAYQCSVIFYSIQLLIAKTSAHK